MNSVAAKMKGIMWEMRPWQWYKQAILLMPLIFSRNLLNYGLWKMALLGISSFSLVAGSNYILNDILDCKEDRKHPEKKERPIASGLISVKLGMLAAIAGFASGFYIAYSINLGFLVVLVAYLAQNLLYSYYLKQLIFVDIIVIAIGFVLRAAAGAIAISVMISPWLIVCTLLAALMLAIGKRIHELEVSENPAETRSTLEEYSRSLLDQLLVMVASTMLLSYSMYSFFGVDNWMMITLPFAYYAVFRYWYLMENGNVAGDPARVLKDRPFMIDIAFWGLIAISVLYVDYNALWGWMV